MGIVDVLLGVSRFLYTFRALLNPIISPIPSFERKLIDNVKNNVELEWEPIFHEHYSRINRSQRHFNPHQITFFCWKFPGRHDWKPELKFEDKPRIKLVHFKLEFKGGETLAGYFNALDGVFCHISYSDDVRRYAKFGEYKLNILSGAIALKGEVSEDKMVF